IVYLDDILIYSREKSKYREHIKVGLYTKPSKCYFYTKHVEFLGFIVTPKGVVIDPIRVKAIKKWPEPKFYKDI
ncbi:hypothetical protein K432DRAFT_316181, partial [Lepidopterella palustris CBS 459.81]